MLDFNLQGLANTAWAFATMGHREETLFAALAAAAEWRMRDFTSQHLATTAWMRDFNSQGLANTAWAFSTVRSKEKRLVNALAVAAGWRLRDFNSQDLANMAWAFATVGHKEE